MKEPLNRTKVVIRHLPPTLSLSSFFDQIDARFSSTYNWSSFRPGKSSYKNQKFARAYINFNKPEDVIEFSEFFGGHVFVNEKGTQYKAIVEYAPSQRVPKPIGKKDGREGTIHKDPEYMEFLERVSKPVENLPSADIQLERREAERAGVHEAPVITPLMDFVRKKRAAKSGNQASGRSGLAPGESRSSKQPDKKKYILKASGRSANGKDKSAYNLSSQRENHLDSSNKKETVENDVGSISQDTVKKRVLLVKGKDQEMTQTILPKQTISWSALLLRLEMLLLKQSKAVASTPEASPPLIAKISQRHDASGKIIRSILLNKDSRQSQPSSSLSTEQKLQALNADKGKRPPRQSGVRSNGPISISELSPLSSDYAGKKSVDGKASGNESHSFGGGRDRQDRRTRSRERLDRGVWTPLRRSDASPSSDGFQSNVSDFLEGKRGDSKYDPLHPGRGAEVAAHIGGRNSSYTDNGSHRQFVRRGPAYSGKDDGPSKKVGIVSHGLHEDVSFLKLGNIVEVKTRFLAHMKMLQIFVLAPARVCIEPSLDWPFYDFYVGHGIDCGCAWCLSNITEKEVLCKLSAISWHSSIPL
ncbi:hypothetical protein KSS87_011673 [Heliosperma pusillum]|nr:hypothetical protein KSS87_011673 [Heliosperma pusillum]